MSGWSLLGNFARAPVATVDRTGGVTPAGSYYTLRWAVGDELGWSRPEQPRSASAVVQRRTHRGGAPLIETTMTVAGGDVVVRTYAAVDSSGHDVVAIDFDNRGAIPVAVALLVDPQTPAGDGSLGRIELRPPQIVLADGVVARSSRPWLASAVSAEGVWDAVASGSVRTHAPVVNEDSAGRLHAAVVMTVPHRTSWRVVISREPTGAQATADYETIVRGWDALTKQAMRVRSPVDAFDRTCAAAVVDCGLHARRGGLDAASRAFAAGVVAQWGVADVGALDELGAEVRFLARRSHNDLTLSTIAAWTWACGHVVSLSATRAVDQLAAPLLDDLAEYADVMSRAATRRWRRPSPTTSAALGAGLLGVASALDTLGQAEPAEKLRRRFAPGAAMWPLSGDPRERKAHDAARRGGDVLVDELSMWMRSASGARNWAESDVPGSQGAGGDGCSARASAVFAMCARALVVNTGDGGGNSADVFPALNEAWVGDDFDVEGVPLAGGARLSVSARYRGPSYALLWEVSDPVAGFALTASGLDPEFGLDEVAGQVMLSTDFSERVARRAAAAGGAVSTNVALRPRR